MPAVADRPPFGPLLLDLDSEQRDELLGTFSDDELRELLHDWSEWRRDEQAPPDTWGTEHVVWFIKCGRGWGKTRTGAETVKALVEAGEARRVALIGRDALDVRKIMVEGESGILSVYPDHLKPIYLPSRKQVRFRNGAIADVFYGTEPDTLRGPEHDLVWCDEPAHWQYPDETFYNAELGLRIGQRPRMIITSTPKPIPLVRKLEKRADVWITRGSTYDNPWLPQRFIDVVEREFGGTRRGRQELHGETLDDNPRALWRRTWIDRARVTELPMVRDARGLMVPIALERIAVGVDPQGTDAGNDDTAEDHAETGIVVAGQYGDHYYVLGDLSMSGSPHEWASAAIAGYNIHHGDRIIAERNNGGDMVESTIRNADPNVPITTVWASRGKVTRAEPVSLLYEQGRVHHVGTFGELEDQCCEWSPGEKSPDHMDALVWAISYLAGLTLGTRKVSIRERIL